MSIVELKRLHEAATPGPWTMGRRRKNRVEIDIDHKEPRLGHGTWECMIECNGCEDSPSLGYAVAEDNAALIAAMRNALPGLIAAVEALERIISTCGGAGADPDFIDDCNAILSRLGVE